MERENPSSTDYGVLRQPSDLVFALPVWLVLLLGGLGLLALYEFIRWRKQTANAAA